MKPFLALQLFLLFLSAISGYLMSQPSLVGRIGIRFFYKEYRFLQVWWQGALAVFIVLSLLSFLQAMAHKKWKRQLSILLHIVLALTGLAGFYLTWIDFHETTTHRWLKDRFHLGVYLFMLGWLIVCVYFLVISKTSQHEKERRHISIPEKRN